MNFKNTLISGEFVKRYKRFFVDVKINNKTVTTHCPNTGSMIGLLKKGNKVWVSKVDNPNRKLKYTLQVIQDKNVKIGINLRGREWTNPEGETKYFNSIQGWRIDVLENNSSTEIPPIPPPTSFEPAEGDANEVDDDLPF